MAKIMAGFDLGLEIFSGNERKIQKLIEQVDSLHATSVAGEPVAPDAFRELRTSLVETQGFVRQAELTMNDHNDARELQDSRHVELEKRLAGLQRDYEQVVERDLGEADT